jgi:hypothetical protein
MLVAGAPLALGQAEDDDRGASFFVEVEGGAEYDSVVSLDELDLSSEVGDTALLANLTVGYARPIGESTEVDLRYSYSVLDYRDVSEVDQNSHVVSADFSRDVGKADIGLTGFYVNSDLDDAAFLELMRVSPYVSGFFREGWFARAAIVYSDKSNEINPGRDASAGVGEIDLYHFPRGKRWFVNVGYKYRDEDARAPRFDYQGNTFKARYVHRLTLLERQARFELSLRRLDRDYSSITPSIDEERFDQRDRIGLQLEMTLTPHLEVEGYYTYSDWESNLDSVDFTQNEVGFRFRYRWER